MTNQPDYEFYLKLEKWTKKDAALLLCGHDPMHYKTVRFSQDDLSVGIFFGRSRRGSCGVAVSSGCNGATEFLSNNYLL